MHFSDEILRQLGPEFTPLGSEHEQLGAWFLISNRDILKASSGRRFSENEGKHPVILATPHGPSATLYPRSTKRGWFHHPAHRHGSGEQPCRVNKNGCVVLRVPITVKCSLLDETSFSCIEPEGTGLLEAIREALRGRRS